MEQGRVSSVVTTLKLGATKCLLFMHSLATTKYPVLLQVENTKHVLHKTHTQGKEAFQSGNSAVQYIPYLLYTSTFSTISPL